MTVHICVLSAPSTVNTDSILPVQSVLVRSNENLSVLTSTDGTERFSVLRDTQIFTEILSVLRFSL